MESVQDLQQRRQLASQVACLTREDFCALARISDATEEAWRKRGKGPPHIVLGRSILYPVAPLTEFLYKRARRAPGVDVAAIL